MYYLEMLAMLKHTTQTRQTQTAALWGREAAGLSEQQQTAVIDATAVN